MAITIDKQVQLKRSRENNLCCKRCNGICLYSAGLHDLYTLCLNINILFSRSLGENILALCVWNRLLRGDACMKYTGWNNLACTLQSSRKQLCTAGHSCWALPHWEQAFNGFLTLVITEENRGHCDLKTNWPDETSCSNVFHPLYCGTCIHVLPHTPRPPWHVFPCALE